MEDLSSIPEKNSSGVTSMEEISFNPEGIKRLLQDLDSKKARGPDEIPTKIIEETAAKITEMVSFLFNQSYKLGQLPKDWCSANLARNLDNGVALDLQIFDFSKAFDKVPHQRLLYKLHHY
ncbi:predicted protein [Nematostella vectensis]|uniref:Reverse transcriptase domain-containing protein n=1 Tax=Nematostella vectensis TaxID=45351 RepID=A7SZT7_NEMVE|nr:predicted protein [Nematostella vectensis]|eukprot:XP_001622877.1 predicted protein [Nematostella vectensis]